MSLEARIAAIEAQLGVAAPLRESTDLLFAKPIGAGGAADFASARGKDPRVAGKPGGGKGLALDANGKMPRRLTILDVYDNGVRVDAVPRSILNIIGAASITDNPAEDRVDVSVGAGEWATAFNDTQIGYPDKFLVAAGHSAPLSFVNATTGGDAISFGSTGGGTNNFFLLNKYGTYLIWTRMLWDSTPTPAYFRMGTFSNFRMPTNSGDTSQTSDGSPLWQMEMMPYMPFVVPYTVEVDVYNGDLVNDHYVLGAELSVTYLGPPVGSGWYAL